MEAEEAQWEQAGVRSNEASELKTVSPVKFLN